MSAASEPPKATMPWIARLHLAATYALLTVGTTGLWLGDPTPRLLPYPLFTAVAALLAYFITDRPNGLQFPILLCNLLAVGILVMVAAEFSHDGAYSVVAMGHFLVYLQMVKFFRRKNDQDLWQLYGLNLLQIAIACVLNRQLSFGVLLAAYTALAVLTLMLFHLRRLHDETASQESWSLRGLFRPWLRTTAFVLPIALAIFWVTPRVGGPAGGSMFGDDGRASRQLTTGFSSTLDLNEMQSVLENREVVFNVWPTDHDGKPTKLPDNLLWRGQVFVSYLNNAWTTATENSSVRSWARNADPLPGQLKLRIQQLIPSRDVLFAPKPLFWARGADSQVDVEFVPSEGRLRFRRLGARGGRGSREPIAYSIIIGVGDEYYRDVEHRSPTAEYLRWTRQIPPNVARIVGLAKQLCADIDPDDVHAKIQKLTNHFEREGGYSYTLDFEDEQATLDRLEEFVLNRKRGHCEYFASALAVMLRAVDVPTRVVTGFKGADFNETGRYYQVRELLAHSWVEAYIAGEDRWQSLDPSPNDLRNQVVDQQRSSWQRMWEMIDAAGNAWHNHFVGYSNLEQSQAYMAMLRDFATFLALALRNLFVSMPMNFFSADFWLSFQGLSAVATALVLWWLGRRVARLLRSLSARAKAFRRKPSNWRLFRVWTREISRLGFHRDLGETPREFARRVANALDADRRFADFALLHGGVVDAFYSVRYGDRPPGDEALHLLQVRLKAFAQAAT